MNKIKQQILIRKIRSGDEQAFGEIYDEYIKKIYHFIFYKTPTPEIAQDLTHDVFANLLAYIKNNPKPIENLKAFIYQIARNMIAKYYIKEKPRDIKIEDKDVSEIDYKLSDNKKMDQEIDLKISVEIIEQSIRQMNNSEHQQIITLKLVEGLSHREISKIINKKEGTVRVQFHRALRELRKIILEKIK